jgi:hypothetical protein
MRKNVTLGTTVRGHSQFQVKIKVKLSQCSSNEHHALKAYWGSEGIASRPGRFTPKERVPGIHWIRSWVHPRAGLDAVVKK